MSGQASCEECRHWFRAAHWVPDVGVCKLRSMTAERGCVCSEFSEGASSGADGLFAPDAEACYRCRHWLRGLGFAGGMGLCTSDRSDRSWDQACHEFARKECAGE